MLSDSCFDFLTAFGSAARKLAEEARWYADPENPISYGDEIVALKAACDAVSEDPFDVEAGADLLRLAMLVQQFYDRPPCNISG